MKLCNCTISKVLIQDFGRNQCSAADGLHGNLPPFLVHLTFDRWKISKNKMWNQISASDDFTTQRFPVFPPVMVCPKCRVPTFYFHKCTIVSKSYIIEIDEMNFHFIASFSTVKKTLTRMAWCKKPEKVAKQDPYCTFFCWAHKFVCPFHHFMRKRISISLALLSYY